MPFPNVKGLLFPNFGSDMRILIYDTTNPNAFVTCAGLLSRKNIEIITLTEKQLLSHNGPIYHYLSP